MTSSTLMRIAATIPQGVADIRAIRLEADAGGPAPARDFIPGQFLHVHAPSGEASYFAIASSPGEPYYELLVKRAKGCSQELFDLPIGTPLRVVGPQGKGFPLASHAGRDVLLIGVGTGIAPLRSLLAWTLSRRAEFGRLILLYGVLTPPHWCYETDFAAWRTVGVDARVTVASTGTSSWSGAVGFVQDLLPTLDLEPARTVACLVGMKDMVDANTALLRTLGVPPERILLNF
ncbi:MAG: oxidoreductase [Nitrospirae bacterium]|nr:oxidoreductase [Nitrospirota bacterium]